MVMNYIAALKRPVIAVALNNREYVVKKSSLLQFFEQQEILSKADDEYRIVKYVAYTLNETTDYISGCFYLDVIEVFYRLFALNESMKIQLDNADGNIDDKFAYDNRALAMIVTKIASAFHWDRDFILNELTWDEVKCYLQELSIAEHSEKEFYYSISEVAYDQKGKRIPFPTLSFGNKKSEVKNVVTKKLKLPGTLRPYGVKKWEDTVNV